MTRLTPEDESGIRVWAAQCLRDHCQDAAHLQRALLLAEIDVLRAEIERLKSCHLAECDLLDFSPDGIQKPCNCIEWQLRRLRSDNALLVAEIATFRNASPSLCNCCECLDLRKEFAE